MIVCDGPKNLKQIYNKKYYDKTLKKTGYTSNFADQIQQITNMIHEHPMIQQVRHSKGTTSSIILYTTEQIQNIKTFCCTGKTVRGFDKTLNLGKFFATVAVFKHLGLTNSTSNEHPIFLGPMFLHGQSTFKSYIPFFASLASELLDTDTSKLTFGTDDEAALRKAIKHSFPESIQIACTRHVINNIKHYLQDKVGIRENERNVLINKIKDLTSADTSILLEELASDITDWCKIHAPKFLVYFNKIILPLIELNSIGTDDNTWTNNNCESINHVLKTLTQWKQQSIPDLIKLIHDHIQAQYKDLERAIVGRGNYSLSDKYAHYYCKPEIWCRKSEEDRKKLLKQFHTDAK